MDVGGARQIAVEGLKLPTQFVAALEKDERFGARMGFLHLYRTGEVGLQHRKTGGRQFIDCRPGQAGTGLKLVDNDPLDLQRVVVVIANVLQRLGDISECIP